MVGRKVEEVSVKHYVTDIICCNKCAQYSSCMLQSYIKSVYTLKDRLKTDNNCRVK